VIELGVFDATFGDLVWQFSPGFFHCSTDKIDRHDITKILLKVAFNTKTTISQVKRIDSWVNIGTCKYSHFQGT
jgi:hypothetical protein